MKRAILRSIPISSEFIRARNVRQKIDEENDCFNRQARTYPERRPFVNLREK
jgi:hypothetical protein